MLIGHFGVALGMKRFMPGINLFWLAVAANFLDLLIWVLALVGVESVVIPADYEQRHYLFFDFPYSHSLVATMIYVTTFGLAGYLFWQRARMKAAVVLGIAVLSHFVLDWLVHPKEMPVAGEQSAKIGVGLWNHIWMASLLELLIFVVGLAMYYRVTRARDRLGKFGPAIMFGSVAALTLAGQLFGSAPPSVTVVAVSGLAMLIVIIALAGWFDGHRTAQNKPIPPRY